MRWILFVIALIASIGWLSCAYEASPARAPVARTSHWRRTVDGWEQISVRSSPILTSTNLLGAAAPSSLVHPHPIVVSLLIAMLSAIALIANDCSSETSDSGMLQTARISEK